RPGLQMLLRIVLPRSIDPTTGGPRVTYLGGPLYQTTGRWQQLEMQQLPQQLERHVRVLRAQFGSQIDARGAYCDYIVLNGYGGPGETNLWIDELEVAGVVHQQAQADSNRPAGTVRRATFDAPPIENPPRAESPASAAPRVPRIALHGTTLLYDGRPVFPRIVEHRGEPFAVLRELGFNTVQLVRPASEAQLREAAAAGVWLICPPPLLGGGETIGLEYHPVLAWH